MIEAKNPYKTDGNEYFPNPYKKDEDNPYYGDRLIIKESIIACPYCGNRGFLDGTFCLLCKK